MKLQQQPSLLLWLYLHLFIHTLSRMGLAYRAVIAVTEEQGFVFVMLSLILQMDRGEDLPRGKVPASVSDGQTARRDGQTARRAEGQTG